MSFPTNYCYDCFSRSDRFTKFVDGVNYVRDYKPKKVGNHKEVWISYLDKHYCRYCDMFVCPTCLHENHMDKKHIEDWLYVYMTLEERQIARGVIRRG